MNRLTTAGILARSNLHPLERPDRLPRAIASMAPWGATLAGIAAAAAGRYPERVAIHDEAGPTSYRDLWKTSRRLAGALASRGVGPGSVVGLLGRNHTGFVTWLVGASATGADVVLLNTGFAGPQAADVVDHEHVTVLIHDDEFAEVAAACDVDRIDEREAAQLGELGVALKPNREQGRIVILTSGTTGRPKGAARGGGRGDVGGAAAVLERIPLRPGDVQVVAAPLFHAWGLTHLMFGLGRCATTFLARRFDPEQALRATSEQGADVLAVVPVMLSRILALPADTLRELSTPELRIIASSGSALGGPLASAVLDRFGPVLYNLYGSTEVAVATIATPSDLQRAPNTAGRVAFGVRVEILDDDGEPVPEGTVGRVFVGGSMRFEGYTGGGGKEERRGLLSSGDLGHFADGLLFVDGREDDMIVSGGENVFPSEVEDLLQAHPAVADAAVVGVADDEFGQVLAAFVVLDTDGELDVDGVRDHVKRHLARHKVPRHVHFLDELPRNPTGKLLRRQLADAASAPDDDTGEKG